MRWQKGYMLLSVMLLVTVMLIALSIELPRIAQQIKRENEEELVHRGKEYAMAIKRYYHSPASRGTYPTSLDQLEGTNNLRFLRRRFKDPMTTDGEWKLIHFGEAEIKLTTPGVGPGVAGSIPGGTGSLSTSPLGGLVTPTPTPSASPGGAGPGLSGTANNPTGTGGQLGTLATTSSPVQAGGVIIGVASKSKATAIKEFNGSDEYDQWLFVFDPRLECQQVPGATTVPGATANPGTTAVPGATAVPGCQGNGITIASPRSPSASPVNPPGPPPSGSPTSSPEHQGLQLSVTPTPPPVGTATPSPSPAVSPQ
jgi:type II secretory pathway pseudopilin PulG